MCFVCLSFVLSDFISPRFVFPLPSRVVLMLKGNAAVTVMEAALYGAERAEGEDSTLISLMAMFSMNCPQASSGLYSSSSYLEYIKALQKIRWKLLYFLLLKAVSSFIISIYSEWMGFGRLANIARTVFLLLFLLFPFSQRLAHRILSGKK